MKYKAEINVMPHKELLDPQGKTVAKNMSHVDISTVEDVRIGKRIEMIFEAGSESEANETVVKACEKILVNMIMERYDFSLQQLN